MPLMEANGSGRWATGEKPWLEHDFLHQAGPDDTEDQVVAAAVAALPLYRSLPTIPLPLALKGITGKPEEVAPLWWRITARYESGADQPQTNDSSWSFETTGGTTKILVSRSTIHRYGSAPDIKGLINATDQDVQGTDITIPQFSFSETHYLPNAAITLAYKRNLYLLTGKMNAATFRELAAHEVLFLGAKGQKRGRGDWELTFSFAASPNVRGLTVGTFSVDKDGWDYLWPRTLPKVIDGQLIRQIVGVYVERVYQEADFTLLGIGV